MGNFNNVIRNTGVEELSTTSGTSTGQIVRSKLERALIRKEWLETWSLAVVELFLGGTTDHVVLILQLQDAEGSRKSFRSFNSWFDKEEVKMMVGEAWKLEVVGNPLIMIN